MTLYSCYQQLGMGWPSVEDRGLSGVPAQWGVWGYVGSAEQNKKLASALCPEDDGMLGYSVVSGYEKNLRTSMNSTQDYVPVTSLLLKDSTTLSMALLGERVFLTLEPGSSREEIVMCTTIDGTSINFETCTRGLSFSGTSVSSVAANRKAHNAGTKVVMSNVHYVYEQLTDVDTDQSPSGNWTNAGNWIFTTGTIWLGDNTTSTDKNLFIRNGESNYPFISYDEATSKWQWSEDGSNTYNFTSSTISTLTAGAGIVINGGAIEVGWDGEHSIQAIGGEVRWFYKAAGGLNQDIDGAYVDPDYIVFDTDTTSTPTASKIPIADASSTIDKGWIDNDLKKFGGDGSDGALTATSGATNIDLGSAAVVVKDYTSISITGTGSVTFSNPHANGTVIYLKSQGDVTITCTSAPCIDASGMGASAASSAQLGLEEDTAFLGGNGATGTGGNSAAGAAGAKYIGGFGLKMYTDSANKLYQRMINVFPGAAGGNGGNGEADSGTAGVGGAGGTGGGALIIEVGGAWNFTKALGISVAGTNGSNGTAAVVGGVSSGPTGGGGGAGGTGGTCLVLYNELTASSGTVNVSSGAGGASGASAPGASHAGTSSGGAGGGTSGNTVAIGNAGAVGASGVDGSVGSNGGGSSGGGVFDTVSKTGAAAGTAKAASGYSLITENKWF